MPILYKKGDSHMVKGVPCDLIIAEESEVEELQKMGWVMNPTDLYPKKKAPKKTTKKKASKK
jgi:hypothetical protein